MMNTQDKMVSLDKVLEIVEVRLAVANERCQSITRKYGPKYLASKPNDEYRNAARVLNEIIALHYELKFDLIKGGN